MMRPSTIALLLALAAPAFVHAQETNAVPVERFDFQSFRIISERNIFNPNRSSRGDRSTRRRDSERRSRTESFGLVGTMNYDKGWFAFFDGSSSDYRKALQPEDTIAGYKIAEIAANHVKLESTNSQPVELHVGMHMRKQDENEWRISDRSEASAADSAATATSSETNSNSSSGAGESDIVKKLMEQREKELQK
jgi:hypothetical protein